MHRGRSLLDRLHFRNGQTLNELCDGLAMTRQAVAKHLGNSRRRRTSLPRLGMAREAALPQSGADPSDRRSRWIKKFERGKLAALSELKRQLEQRDA